jgi:amino acid adenylation domain-containing protein
MNMLALRTDLSGDPTFRALLQRVREVALGAYAHQDLPFEKLVEELQPVRDLSRQPIFQVLLALQNVPQETLELPGIKLRRMGGEHVTAKLDLSLYLQETEQGLRGQFEYATDLFEGSTIRRLAGHFETMLAGIVADPDGAISALPLLSDAERYQLVTEWNDTAADYPADKCLHELFAEQAGKTPDAVAAVFEDQELTYGELERRSNQLAHHLRDLGVGPEVIVGLCVERSLEMLVGLLGILKAGGAYLPLDPSYPRERLAYMLVDARAPVLVTQAWLEDVLPAHAAHVVRLDTGWREVAAEPEEAVASGVGPDNLAYVIYTSGSTGKPKGVMGPHRTIVNRLQWDAGAPDEVYAHKTTLNFIDALWELFMPLTRGQRVAIVVEEASKDPRRLVEALAAEGASRIVVVPTLLLALLESKEDLSERLPRLRYWACSGEALPAELADRFARRLPEAVLLNIYGTSEFWDASWHEARPGDARVPVGCPLSNMRLYVLDAQLQPVPIGVSGELYIGGVGLARGYLGRAGLTAERFIPDPFGSGDRLYRSGDLARWRADGELEYLGRIDHQVKLRGYRIELGEIEAALSAHPGVAQAVVVAREDAPGENRLAAYVVRKQESGAIVESSELRTHLKRSLPEYMVPTAFVVVDALPLTANGKINRGGLPMPERGALAVEYETPRTPTEDVLARIWCEVLRLDRVGVNDNFFDLGGHSLVAMRLIGRVREAFQVELPVRTLFETRLPHTIAGMALVVEEKIITEIEQTDIGAF